MQYSQLPTKFPIPWANAAGNGFIRPIPTASQIGSNNGQASLTDGFVPLNFQPVGSGGIPPSGQDFNGILNQITAWCQRQAAGQLTTFDSTFSSAIGGYPMYAMLASTTPGVIWVSTADNNTSNPDGGSPTGWVPVGTSSTTINNIINGASVNAFVAPSSSNTVPSGGSATKITNFGTITNNIGGRATWNAGSARLTINASGWFNISIVLDTNLPTGSSGYGFSFSVGRNGGSSIVGMNGVSSSVALLGPFGSAASLYQLSSGDYLEAYAAHNYGSSLNIPLRLTVEAKGV